MSVDVAQLMTMTQAELDVLFNASPPGEIPSGKADGRVLVAPGTHLEEPAARLIHLIAWHGKVFHAAKGQLINELLPINVDAVVARVYAGPSWFDAKPCIILDYSKTSLVAHWIRDEIRNVAPGIYLGLVFWERTRILHFLLSTSESALS